MTKYTTIAGDMWDAIAYKTLGDEAYTDRIMKLNPEYRRLFVFPAGIVLTIPEPESQVRGWIFRRTSTSIFFR